MPKTRAPRPTPRTARMVGAAALLLAGTPLAAQVPADTLARADTARFLDAAELPFTACALIAGVPLSDLAGPMEELLRLSEIAGRTRAVGRGLRRASDDLDACPAAPALRAGGLEVSVVAPAVMVVSHSGYPEDRNNGGLWAGRGVSGQASGGVRVKLGPVSAGVVPAVRWAQNDEYAFPVLARPGYADVANPFYNTIDLPLRFGSEPFTETSLNQSWLRVDAGPVSAGVSTENVWLGPSPRNPILLSNTAEGFPHAFLRTRAPLDVGIGRLDASVLLGRVEESDWFDANPANDEGRLAAWTLTLRPRGLDELELGVGRTYRYLADDPPDGAFGALGVATGDHEGLGMLSLFGRFRLPESAADVWAEWARTDGYTTLVDDLIMEPEHSQAFVVGFQKVSDSWIPLRFLAEAAHLQEKQRERIGRALPVYYTHPVIRQGHTHRGQLLGAGIGPGADAQYIEIDALFEHGLAGFFVERLRRNDASKAAVELRFDSYLHDTQLTGGLRGTFAARGLLLGASAAYSHRIQRDFMGDDTNLSFTMTVSWWPQ